MDERGAVIADLGNGAGAGNLGAVLEEVFLVAAGLLQLDDFLARRVEAVGLNGGDYLALARCRAWCFGRHISYQSISALSVPVLAAGAVASLTSKP